MIEYKIHSTCCVFIVVLLILILLTNVGECMVYHGSYYVTVSQSQTRKSKTLFTCYFGIHLTLIQSGLLTTSDFWSSWGLRDLLKGHFSDGY